MTIKSFALTVLTLAATVTAGFSITIPATQYAITIAGTVSEQSSPTAITTDSLSNKALATELYGAVDAAKVQLVFDITDKKVKFVSIKAGGPATKELFTVVPGITQVNVSTKSAKIEATITGLDTVSEFRSTLKGELNGRGHQATAAAPVQFVGGAFFGTAPDDDTAGNPAVILTFNLTVGAAFHQK